MYEILACNRNLDIKSFLTRILVVTASVCVCVRMCNWKYVFVCVRVRAYVCVCIQCLHRDLGNGLPVSCPHPRAGVGLD